MNYYFSKPFLLLKARHEGLKSYKDKLDSSIDFLTLQSNLLVHETLSDIVAAGSMYLMVGSLCV